MSATTQELAAARTAIQSVTAGAAVKEDAWMTQWCSTNWGDLLQPAPLSIALLGSILIIASSTDDFSLDSKAPPGVPPFEWKYARYPDSSKARPQQTASAWSQRCRDEARESERAFHDMAGLSQEMVLACTYASYIKAENQFADAIHGMALVEGFTDVINGIGSIFSSGSSLNAQGSKAGINAFSKSGADPASVPVAPSTSPNGVSSLPNSDALSDPATPLVPMILAQSSTSGALCIQTFLRSQKRRLDMSKSMSQELSKHIETALNIVGVITETAGGVASTQENVLVREVSRTNELITALQTLTTSANLILQQPGSSSKGLFPPPTPTDTPGGAGPSAAIQNAVMKIEQTKAQLEAARDSYKKSAERLVAQQQEITNMIVELTQISLTGATLEQMIPVLKKAIGSFTALRAQFSQLVQFFDSVASLLCDIMGPSIDRWVNTLTVAEAQIRRGAKESHLGGVTISQFTRDLIYKQMTPALKVSMLANKISATYVSVSKDFILPAQRNVANLLQFAASTSAEDRTALKVKLTRAQSELQRSTALASTQIAARISGDQKTFEESINTRIHAIVKAVQGVLPAVDGPVQAHIRAVTEAHVADTDTTKALQKEVNPIRVLSASTSHQSWIHCFLQTSNEKSLKQLRSKISLSFLPFFEFATGRDTGKFSYVARARLPDKSRVHPLLYRVLILNSTASESYLSAIQSKSPEFLCMAVRHVLLVASMPETINNALLECTGIESLMVQGEWQPHLLPILNKTRPRKLNLSVQDDGSQWAKSTLNQPLFLSLTHLEIFTDPSEQADGEHWDDWWSGLAALPALTHLCLSEELSNDILRPALAECPRLIVAINAFWMPVDAGSLFAAGYAQDLTIEDSRIVVMLVEDCKKDWKTGAGGGEDFWARAEKFVARKRRGEIESAISCSQSRWKDPDPVSSGTCYYLDERVF
ncbi:hypothetical protein K438DRAFT_2009980 [Mycena galopus ATCC 62051]|nr:hypothetical protein K438DRAFT_2009980 [Mycena galopus ATCC 62051]